jgi:hypothetical protein
MTTGRSENVEMKGASGRDTRVPRDTDLADRRGGPTTERARSVVRGILGLHKPKNVFRPMGCKLAFSFWCDGLVRERLDGRRTANVAADAAAGTASG